MKKLFALGPTLWGLLSVALMSAGAAWVYPPAGLIVAGLALFIDAELDRGTP